MAFHRNSPQLLGLLLLALLLLLLLLRRLKQRQIFAVAFFLQFFRRNKAQRGRVHAETLTGREAHSDQPAFAKISEISARRAFDQIDGEFKQANFPGVIDALDDGAERFVCVLDATPGAIDHRVD